LVILSASRQNPYNAEQSRSVPQLRRKPRNIKHLLVDPSVLTPESISTLAELRQALVRSDARFEALIQRAGYGVYRSSLDGKFVDANRALATMLGYDGPTELLGLELTRDVYVDPEERERLLQRPAETRSPDWVETRWKRRDGSHVTVRLSVLPIVGNAGRLDCYDGLVEDVTERQRQDELLRRNERLATLGTTLAGVAHELNNPLAAIIGFSQLLLKKSWTADDRAALEAINHEAIRSATIVRDLLALTRRRDGARKVLLSINDIVGYIARTRRYALETRGIACRLELDSALPMVFGDRAQFEQVVLNLVNNAEQALRPRVDGDQRPGAAHITIRTRREKQEIVLDVEDNGPGIPAESHPRIWDPFWTTNEEGGGTGLGLTVVHGIVADHGGTISVESAPGLGARFIIRLPVGAETSMSNSTSELTGQASRPLDVLIVDPSASDLGFVERFLTSRGHAVISSGSGDLALRLATQTTFDAVVCSARLVNADGVAVANLLRKTAGCEQARFVLSVATNEYYDALDGLETAAFVSRPYDVEELRRLIEGD
jgi:two-component system, cell cycle sensor histidine kinase and response regulator CckA